MQFMHQYMPTPELTDVTTYTIAQWTSLEFLVNHCGSHEKTNVPVTNTPQNLLYELVRNSYYLSAIASRDHLDSQAVHRCH